MFPARHRLRRNADFQRLRRLGRAWHHRLLVLIVAANDLEASRFAVAAGRRLGNAVIRNRCERRIRETLRPYLREVEPGWDCLFIARQPLVDADAAEVQRAVKALLIDASLLD